MDSDVASAKRRLRATARARRDRFVADRCGVGWTAAELRFDERFDRGVSIASYRARGSEADPSVIDRIASRSQMFTSYPRVDADGLMRFYGPGPSRMFERDAYGIEVPAADARLADPAIILIPLLAFDRSGRRLGQGGGHYDRALVDVEASMARQGYRAFKVGIAWSVQEETVLPTEPWDVRLDVIITEREWIVT